MAGDHGSGGHAGHAGPSLDGLGGPGVDGPGGRRTSLISPELHKRTAELTSGRVRSARAAADLPEVRARFAAYAARTNPVAQPQAEALTPRYTPSLLPPRFPPDAVRECELAIPYLMTGALSGTRGPFEAMGYRRPNEVHVPYAPAFSGSPSPGQIFQGPIGDCSTLAAAGAVARYRPGDIEARLQVVDDRAVLNMTPPSYEHKTVVIDNQVPVYRTGQLQKSVGAALPSGENPANWPFLWEKGVAACVGGWDEIGNGRDADFQQLLVESLTGREAAVVYDNPPGEGSGEFSNRAIANILGNAHTHGRPTVVSVSINAKDSPQLAAMALEKGLVLNHAYWLDDFDAATGTIQLGNPWGPQANPDPLTIDEFRQFATGLVVGA